MRGLFIDAGCWFRYHSLSLFHVACRCRVHAQSISKSRSYHALETSLVGEDQRGDDQQPRCRGGLSDSQETLTRK